MLSDAFEQQWIAGTQPSVEDYLHQTTEPERSMLLRELLAVELAYCRQIGEEATPDEYTERFPDHAEIVADVFRRDSTADLVAIGPEPQLAWRRPIPIGEVVRLGRAPRAGWAIPWDSTISREHVDIVLVEGRLRVRCLDTALNPIFFQGRASPDFMLSSGEVFCIGHTTFRMVEVGVTSQTPLRHHASIPDSLGKYKIEGKIGAGGMGTVYLARDTQLKRTVALKVLASDSAKDSDRVKRFRAEALSAAQLTHTNIVTIYDAGETDACLYIALEYVDGTDVKELLKQRKSIPIEQSLDVVRQVTRALEHAWKQGVVHRDIKPSNVLICADGTVKLTDMGLAYSAHTAPEGRLTRDGFTVGTINYMSAEQAENSKSADVRSDIYSLGCTWYEMLTGTVPFPEEGLAEIVNAHATWPRPDPRKFNQNVPQAMVEVLHRMMAQKPQDRYQTPAELLEDLMCGHLTGQRVVDNALATLEDKDDKAARIGSPTPKRVDGSEPPQGDSTVDEACAETHSEIPIQTSESQRPLTDIAIRCDNCGKRYKVSDGAAGRHVKCKDCGHPIEVKAKESAACEASGKTSEAKKSR